MPRKKKDARILNVKLSSSIYNKLDEHCKNTGMNKTKTVEVALQEYLSNENKEDYSQLN